MIHPLNDPAFRELLEDRIIRMQLREVLDQYDAASPAWEPRFAGIPPTGDLRLLQVTLWDNSLTKKLKPTQNRYGLTIEFFAEPIPDQGFTLKKLAKNKVNVALWTNDQFKRRLKRMRVKAEAETWKADMEAMREDAEGTDFLFGPVQSARGYRPHQMVILDIEAGSPRQFILATHTAHAPLALKGWTDRLVNGDPLVAGAVAQLRYAAVPFAAGKWAS
ncbi:hypothetical protein Q0812_10230 [Brevundimonas sp. 2R-24]|uniref:Uncharacterized protein n=1 Tax=Peiella sedimenti TaxID=3061083 RepID=A0ABT8SML0_9CAUL|nr:hypothetical protein [Caulobacteraceae bacterium XZ-24]